MSAFARVNKSMYAQDGFVLLSPVGGPHSLREVGRGDGGGREQWRREKNAQVPPVVEAKRGGGRGGSGVDSSPRPAV